jgi:hypothetical protein
MAWGTTNGRFAGRAEEDEMAASVSESDVIKMISSLSNWGRWGADDQLGTMNLITPAKRKRAAALVQDGVPVSCARSIVTNEISADTTIQPVRFMVDSGEGRDHDSSERILQRRGAAEFIGMVFHGYSITHIDTPAHYFLAGQDVQRALGKPDHVARGRAGGIGRPAPRRGREPRRAPRHRRTQGALARGR